MKVIEFFGMPRAGKTEQIQKLKSYLDYKKIKYVVITDREIEKEIHIPLEKAYEYNTTFFNLILERLLEAEYSKKCDVVVLDRGFYDADVWFNVEYMQKNLTKGEKELALSKMKNLRKKIDVGILMIVDIKTTKFRHENKGESGLSDDYVLNNYVGKLFKEYKKLAIKYKDDRKVLILDGNESIDKLSKKIIEKLENEKIIPLLHKNL